MRVTVISPDAAVFDGDADSVVAPAIDGSVGILTGHAPLMTMLGSGTLVVRTDGVVREFRVQGGFLQVVKDTVRILAERIDRGTDGTR
ncbi:MAG: ATP synthase F1 subunit epsilon [Gemmatimonadales bacterium]